MATKHKPTPVRGIIIYITLISVTGIILSVTGHFDNPLTAIAASLSAEHGEVSKGAQPENGARTEDKSGAAGQNNARPNENKTPPSDQGDPTLTHEEAESINWSRVGDVFFDIWFIAFVSATIIVVQYAISFVWQRMKQPTVQPKSA